MKKSTENTFLSKPVFLAPLDDSCALEDFSVLTDRKTIRTIAKKICDALHHPVTIIDINRAYNMFNEDIRIDSEIEYFSLRLSCRLFRHCAGEEKCHICDEYHATYFKHYILNSPAPYEKQPSFFCENYLDNPPKILKGFQREVLEYHCPMLGYRELLFPLFFAQKLIGILFLGQSIVLQSSDKELLPKIQEAFFEKDENHAEKLFSDFLEVNYQKSDETTKREIAQKIKSLILSSDQNTEDVERFFRLPRYCNNSEKKQMTMIFETEDDYERFIKKACEELSSIEEDFLNEYAAKRKKYFDSVAQKAVKSFLNNTVSINNTSNNYKNSQNALKIKWDSFYTVIQELKKDFEFKDIIIFGDGTSLSIEENRKKYIFAPQSSKNEKIGWYCDFTSLELQELFDRDYVCSIEKPEILERLHSTYYENVILILYLDMGILIKVESLANNESLYLSMANAIGHNFLRIRLSIALSRANLMQERHVLTLRMNRHESTHISTKLSDNMKRYFKLSGLSFVELDDEKRKLVIDDMVNTIQLISHMANNIGVITGSINSATIRGKEKRLDVFDMLYKWQIMFRDMLRDRNLDLVIIRETDPTPPCFSEKFPDAPRFINANSELFELLIYNLVDNAVKYAYIGSKIYLRWNRIENNKLMFSVTDFGPKIEEKDRIFELYARGSTNNHNYVDGDGIGLYVVKRIEELLNIHVNYSNSFISEYHLPLVPWYIKEPFNDMIRNQIKKELSNYQNNTDWEFYSSIINDNTFTEIRRRDLSVEYLDAKIKCETWKTTFYVIV